MPFPVLEIHMSNIAPASLARSLDHRASGETTIQGLGWRSYTAGLRALGGNGARDQGYLNDGGRGVGCSWRCQSLPERPWRHASDAGEHPAEVGRVVESMRR